MYSSDENIIKVEKKKTKRGEHLKALRGKKLDRNSESFKRWSEKHKLSRSRTTRRKYEALAKAPLKDRVSKGKPYRKYDRNNYRSAKSNTSDG